MHPNNNDDKKSENSELTKSTFKRLNPLDLPNGDVERAIEHGRANMLYCLNPDKIKDVSNIRKCECCEQLLQKNELGDEILSKYPFCTKIKDLSKSGGVGIYLYFHFLKFCVWSLIIVSILSSIPFIYLSFYTRTDLKSFCDINLQYYPICNEKVKNTTNWLGYITSENFRIYRNITEEIFLKDNKNLDNYPGWPLIDYNFITLITELVLLLVYLIMYNNFLNQSGEVDIENLTPSDYTLMISEFNDLPEDVNNFTKLKEYLETEDIKIHSIIPAYNLHKYFVSYKKFYLNFLRMSKLNSQKLDKIEEGMMCCKNIFTKEKITQDLQDTKVELKIVADDLMKNNQTFKYFSKVAFVIFKSIGDYEDYFAYFPHSILNQIWFFIKRIFYCCCKVKARGKSFKWMKTFLVDKAPEPEDIIWENLHFTNEERTRRMVKTYIFSILLSIINLGIIFGLNYAQDKYNSGKITDYAISVGISSSITVINTIIMMVLRRLSNYEKPKCFTELYLTMSIKLTFLTFLNSAILPVLANLAIKSWNLDLLITNVFMIFITNSFVSPLLTLFDFSYLYMIFSRKCASKELSQRELNLMYENPSMDIAYKYSYIFKTILTSLFFVTLFPLGVLISLAGIIFSYVIEKYLTLNRYKKPESINDTICLSYMSYFKIALFIYSIGNYIFVMNVEQVRRLDLLLIIGFGIFIIFPVHRLFSCSYLGSVESQINKLEYDEAKSFFFFDYYNLNPIEDLDNQMNNVKNSNLQTINVKKSNNIKMSEFKKNMLVNGNIILRAVGGDKKILQSIPNKNNENGFSNIQDNNNKMIINQFAMNAILRNNKSKITESIQTSSPLDQKSNVNRGFADIPNIPEEHL